MILSYSEKQFLDLVKLSLNDIPVPDSLMDEIDWDEIYAHAKKQTVVGITFDAINKLPAQFRPPKEIVLQWFSQTRSIEIANRHINAIAKEVVEKYSAAGIDSVLLKGQGLAQHYPNPLHRQPGDIDLYFHEQYDEANKQAATWDNTEFKPDTSYHRAFTYKGVCIENHLVYVDFYNKKNRKAWQEIEKEIPLTKNEHLELDGLKIKVPQPQINVIYVFLHLAHHMLQVGVGLRQVCDWMCLWNAKHHEVDKELFLMCVDKLRMKRLMTAMAYIAENYLGLQKGIIPLDTTGKKAKKDGEMIIKDIIDSGNFGHETNIMKGFKRNKHIGNIKSYLLAAKRQMRFMAICPSEVSAYPREWLIMKFKGK